MGIKQLTKLLNDNAPGASKNITLGELNGRKIAIDASMAIYQFLVAVRSGDGAGGPSAQLTNDAGEVTSHLIGMWYRTIKFVEAGIKPVFVFDGKPPVLKGGELAKRSALKAEATKALDSARESGVVEDIERFSKRTVKMEKVHITDCQKLLRLMGMPVIEAPSEAEAQCAVMAKADLVYAAASEDMDTLTFGAPRLVRRMWASESSTATMPMMEISLPKALSGLDVTYDQFVDLCILSGCDYADTIKGVAAVSALKLIKTHGTIAAAVASLDKEKHPTPEGVDYAEVRRLFVAPEVMDPATIELKWGEPDEAGIKAFLVTEKGFQESRVDAGIAKLRKARAGGQQMRMDAFFKATPATAGAGGSSSLAGAKRKAESKPSGKDKAGGKKPGSKMK